MKGKMDRFVLVFCLFIIASVGFVLWLDYKDSANRYGSETIFTASGNFIWIDVSGWIESYMKYDYVSTVIIQKGEVQESYTIAGAWNGPLPEKNTLVTISSPTGYAKDLTITSDDGTVFRCQGLCLYPEDKSYDYRVTDRDSFKVMCEGTVLAPSSWEAMKSARCEGHTLYELCFEDQWLVQMWASDQTAPPYITK